MIGTTKIGTRKKIGTRAMMVTIAHPRGKLRIESGDQITDRVERAVPIMGESAAANLFKEVANGLGEARWLVLPATPRQIVDC